MKANISGVFAILLLSATAAQAQTVGDAIKAAQDKEHNGDFDQAIPIYDAILTQFPKEFPEVYVYRAEDRGISDDDKGAIADYTKALELDSDPKAPVLDHARIYWDRGKIKNGIGDDKGAIADYHAALKDHPTETFLFADLAEAELGTRDCGSSASDYSQAIALAKEPEVLFFENRAIAYLCAGNIANSYSDYQSAIALEAKETPPPLMGDMYLNAWALGVKLGRKDDADKALTLQLTQTTPEQNGTDRARNAAGVLLGKADVAVVMKDAQDITAQEKNPADDIWIANANYYAGLKAVGDGDTKGAVASFQKVVSARRNFQFVRLLATSWIKVLGGSVPAAAPARSAAAAPAKNAAVAPAKEK